MSHELLIEHGSEGDRIALLKDKVLIELHQESKHQRFHVGDVLLGKVRRIASNLNATFVDVGFDKDAFLHYTDLGPNIRSQQKLLRATRQGGMNSGELNTFKFEPETLKTGKIGEVLSKNKEILVQVEKEPISSKGPRVSGEITLAGKYFILIPFSNTVSISKKVAGSDERERLKKLTHSLKPKNFGLICRTAAEGKAAGELHKDLQDLLNKWNDIFTNVQKAKVGYKVWGENSKVWMTLKDLLSLEFQSIVTNDKAHFEQLKSFLKANLPDLVKKLKLHKGDEPLFHAYNVEKQIKQSFGKKVTTNGGGYLIVEHTEALHVIDVNSGNIHGKSTNLEDSALKVNLEAASEIARQLRLRDMGGIIVIDFIDLKNPAYKRKLTEALKDAMEGDRARHTILPMTKFGLVQITRQRVRPEMNITTSEVCPTCKGSGRMEASILLEDEIENHVHHVLTRSGVKSLEILTNPFIQAYLTNGLWSKKMQWMLKYRKKVTVTSDKDMHYGEYHFFDQKEEEIILN